MTAILYIIIAIAIGIAVGAGILMLAARVAAGFMPRFPISVAVVIVQFIAALIVSWLLNMALGTGTLTSLVSLVVLFLVYTAITNLLLKRPDGNQLGFGKASLVTLIQLLIQIVLGVILAFVFGAAVVGLFAGAAAG